MPIPESSNLNAQLLLAAQRTKPEIVRDLLALGADANAREPRAAPGQGASSLHSEKTALMRAAESLYADDICSFLLAAGADVHATDTAGNCALGAAMEHGHGSAVRVLMAAGTRPTPTTTPRFLAGAAWIGDAELVRLALDTGFNPNGEVGTSAPLVRAVSTAQYEFPPPDNLECIAMLLAAGADVQARDSKGEPVMMSAAVGGHLPVLQALLEAGAAPDARNAHGLTASLRVAGGGHAVTPLLELLFQFGARFDVADKDGFPLLHYAARGADETGTMCRLILQAGAPLESRDPQGQTALMSAAKSGRGSAVRALLEAGADLNARDGRDWTPLMHAVWIEPQIAYDANIVPPQTAWNHSSIAYLRDDIKRFNKQRAGMRECAQILLDAGADPLAQASDGQSVIQLAASDTVDGALQLIENARGKPGKRR